MKDWFKDGSFRSLLKNTSYQALSKTMAALCNVAALAFAGRGLGPHAFGLLVLVQSYVGSVSGVAKFQSWQLVIRFGTKAPGQEASISLNRAVAFGLGLDLLSAAVGTVVAILLLPILAPSLHIPEDVLPYARIYCLLLPTMAAATPIGVLRALDRFDLIGWQGTITPILRGVLALAAWLTAAPFPVYLGIWFASGLCGDISSWVMAWSELYRRNLSRRIRPVFRPRELEGAWKFAISTNVVTSLNTILGPVGNLLVGAILGPAAAGIYRVARTIAQSVERPADFLEKAFYPEVLRLESAGKRAWRLTLRGAAAAASIAAVMCAVILIGGRYLIPSIFGARFEVAYPVTAIMLIATVLSAASFPVVPMLYTVERTGSTVTAKIFGASVFLLGVYPLCRSLGLIGAGLAFVLGELATLVFNVATLRREYGRLARTFPERRPIMR